MRKMNPILGPSAAESTADCRHTPRVVRPDDVVPGSAALCSLQFCSTLPVVSASVASVATVQGGERGSQFFHPEAVTRAVDHPEDSA